MVIDVLYYSQSQNSYTDHGNSLVVTIDNTKKDF